MAKKALVAIVALALIPLLAVVAASKLLNIGKIKLDGIGVSLSMNKDGAWEFDKWKTASTAEASPKVKTDKTM